MSIISAKSTCLSGVPDPTEMHCRNGSTRGTISQSRNVFGPICLWGGRSVPHLRKSGAIGSNLEGVSLICVQRTLPDFPWEVTLGRAHRLARNVQTGNMGSEQINPIGPNEPELHLLLANDSFEEPLWKSLFRQLDEFFFPKKLPPLKLESKPEPVKDIWGFYNYKRDGALDSTGVHILIAAIIVAGTVTWTHSKPTPIVKATVVLVDPNDIPNLKPGKTVSGG